MQSEPLISERGACPTEHQGAEDIELAGRAARGHVASFESLFRKYYRMIYAFAYRLCGHRSDAEDVAQETFVRAARFMSRFRGDASFKNWLYRLALNAANDCREKRARERRKVLAYARSAGADRSCRGDGNPADENARRILRALDTLSPVQRQAIVLTVYEGLSHAQAARVSGCAETTISWRVHRARRTLKQRLGGVDDDE